MRWLLKCPAPSDSRQKKWGDYHVARALTRYLERAGQEVEVHYDPHWHRPDVTADVVLVLRGKYDHPPSQRVAGARHVMWNISHPASVSREEYASYDLVLVASDRHAEVVSGDVDTPCLPLLQATDLEEFHLPEEEVDRQGLVFVGNTRDEPRPVVSWALDYGLAVRIWGRGWEHLYDDLGLTVQGDYLPNEELGDVYRASRATLNDHWPDMRAHGFVNNRVFDALACGLPVISDHHDSLAEMDLPGVLLYRDRLEFEHCAERLLLDHPELLRASRATAQRLATEFSFEARVRTLMEQVARL